MFARPFSAQYRDPITIQTLKDGVSPNEMGEAAVFDEANWQDYFPCFAEVIVKGTRDFVRAGMAEADITHIIRVPYSTETIAVKPLTYRVLLGVTGEKIHITEAYRRDASNREVEILGVN
ncbi:MAG: head-tail adaptor protein [Planctomycetes bacterium]|nr:head-tail adaptor protein [Planctomycetota bacterium]